MIRRYRFYNDTDLTREQIISLMPSQLPYGLKFADIRPVVGEFYDYLLTVEASAKFVRDHR